MTYGLENLAEFPEKEKLEKLFEQYKKEMLYLRNLSEKTLNIYQQVFNHWQKYVGEMPTEKTLSRFVIGMREAGLNTTSCNISIRGYNSFLTWLKYNNPCKQTVPQIKFRFFIGSDLDSHRGSV